MKVALLALSLSLLRAPFEGAQVQAVPGQRGARQASPPESEVKPEDRCAIEGMVINAQTGEPLKKAQITLSRMESGARNFGATTDANGRFTLANLDPGRYRLSARRNGFGRQDFRQINRGQAPSVLTLEPRQRLRDLVLRLMPATVVSGRVTDEDGEPLANVRIMAMRYTYFQGRRQLMPAGGGAQTDDLGQYRLHSLARGRYYISATYMDLRNMMSFIDRSPAASEEAYTPVYYPGVPDPGLALMLQLREGEERRGVDFKLTPARTVRIHGRVLGAFSGRPGPNVAVRLTPRQSAGLTMPLVPPGPVDDRGNFELRWVTPGSYTLVAFLNYEGNQLTARQQVEVGNSDLEGIEMVLKPGIELKGRVRIEGETVEKITLEGLRAGLRPRDEAAIGRPGGGAVASDGSFTLRNVIHEDYRVVIGPMPADFYLKGAKLGDEEVLEKGLSIGNQDSGGALELVLSAAGGRIEGVVLDDENKTVGGVTVVLVPELKRRIRNELFKNTTADQNGRFTLRGIPPGEYKLFAWDQFEPGAYQDPDFLEPYEDKGKKVTVQEKSQQAAELPLLHVTETPL